MEKPGRVPRTIDLQVIGFVRNRASQGEIRKNKKNIVSEIVIEKDLSRALLGIESYSHIFVIYFMHEIPEEERMQLRKHPRHQKELKKVGVFAVREPARPNPIGLTIVELLGRKGNVLKVKGLDALNGSPVLDIKPYDYMDVTKNIRVPEWWSSIHPLHAPRRKK
jgi:tRNA (adenine37-N6)-methyltransferase